MKKRRRSQIPVKPALVGIAAIAVAAVALALPGGKPKTTVAANHTRHASGEVTVASVATKTGARKPLSFYTGAVRGDLFSSPEAVAAAKPKPQPPPPPPPPPPVVVDPFDDYAYKGTVTVGGKTMALVENVKTAEGTYLGVGDFFLGAKVTEVGDRLLSFDRAGKPKILAMTDNYNLVPLTKSADFLTKQAQPGQNGPGGPGQGMGRGRGRFQNMTPDQRQQMMQNWMNRSFDGGGGRRRGGGGGWGGNGWGGGGMGFGGGFGGG